MGGPHVTEKFEPPASDVAASPGRSHAKPFSDTEISLSVATRARARDGQIRSGHLAHVGLFQPLSGISLWGTRFDPQSQNLFVMQKVCTGSASD